MFLSSLSKEQLMTQSGTGEVISPGADGREQEEDLSLKHRMWLAGRQADIYRLRQGMHALTFG